MNEVAMPAMDPVIRIYRGKNRDVSDRFVLDAAELAKRRLFPISSVWVPGSYTTFHFCATFLAVFLYLKAAAYLLIKYESIDWKIIATVLIFSLFPNLYLLTVRPSGELIVTYTIRM